MEDRYIGVLSRTFYCNRSFIVISRISKIVISGFYPVHFTVTEFSSLYGEYRYIEDRFIGVPLHIDSVVCFE